MQLTSILLAGVLSILPGRGERRVAVLVVGEDSQLSGQIQTSLGETVADVESVGLIPPAEIASTVGVPVSGESAFDEATAALSAKLLDEAEKAYYADELDRAQRALDAVIQHYERSAYIVPEQRVMLHLWEVSLALAKDSDDDARRAALAALTLDPELAVDTNVFRPTTKRLVESLRPVVAERLVTLRIEGAPDDATLTLDGRKIDREARLPRGTHFLTVEAPGFLPVDYQMIVREDTTVEVELPVALSEEVERAILDVVFDGEATTLQRTLLTEVANELDADVLVLAAHEKRRSGRVRCFFWYRAFKKGRATAEVPMDQLAGLNERIVEEFESPDPLPVPADAWIVQLSAGPVFNLWHREFHEQNSDLFFSDGGFGLSVEGRVNRRVWLGQALGAAQADFVTYSLGATTLERVGGGVVGENIHVGQTLRARFHVGYQLLAKRKREIPSGIGLTAGVIYERYGGSNLSKATFPNGQPLEKWVHHIVAGPEAGLVMQASVKDRVGIYGDLRLNLPLFLQNPPLAFGVEPQPFYGIYASTGLSTTVLNWWEIRANAGVTARTVEFIVPQVVGGQITEAGRNSVTDSIFELGLIVRRRF